MGAASETTISAAAETLDELLRSFEAAAEALRKLPLTTQKNLERAGRSLEEVAKLDDELGRQVQALVAVIQAARERQQQQALGVQQKAEELKLRTEEYQKLLEQMAALGQDASSLNAAMLEYAGASSSGQAGGFEPLAARLQQIVEGAESLASSANDKQFSDVARQADSLRQQLLAARNKLSLLHRKISGPPN